MPTWPQCSRRAATHVHSTGHECLIELLLEPGSGPSILPVGVDDDPASLLDVAPSGLVDLCTPGVCRIAVVLKSDSEFLPAEVEPGQLEPVDVENRQVGLRYGEAEIDHSPEQPAFLRRLGASGREI